MGIDPDTKRLDVARKKYSASNITYLEGRGEDIPGSGYDIVFSNSVLHWCEDKNLVFKNVAKSLKQGGKFGFVTVADFDAKKELFTPPEMFSPRCYNEMIKHTHPVTSDEYKSIAAANNFEVTHLSKHLQEWKFDNIAKLIDFYITHYKGQFSIGLEDFNVKAMEKRFGDKGVSIFMPYITVVAQKLN